MRKMKTCSLPLELKTVAASGCPISASKKFFAHLFRYKKEAKILLYMIYMYLHKENNFNSVYSEFEICVFVIILDYVLEAQTCWVTCYYFKFSMSRQRGLVFVYAKKSTLYISPYLSIGMFIHTR